MTEVASETVTLAQAIQMALAHHQSGRLPQAEAIYRQILKMEPNHPEALYFLGILAKQVGKYEIAAELIGRVLPVWADCAEAHYNLGDAHQSQGKLDEAVSCYRKALELKPDYAEAYGNLGIALRAQGKLDEAVDSYRKAIMFKPDHVEAYYNLGNVLQQQGKLDEAASCYRKALEIKPDYLKAYGNLGNVLRSQGRLVEALENFHKALIISPDSAEMHYNLGNVLKDQDRLDEAIESFHKALELKPDFAEAHNNLGNVLLAQGRLDEALDGFHKALVLKPDYAEAHNNVGTVLLQQGALDAALESFHDALRLKPDYAEACSNQGNVFKEKGELTAASSCYRQAMALDPAQETCRLNHGIFLLSVGDFKGWKEYEARWEGRAERKLKYPHPWWDGGDLGGKTILVWSEQGIGDELLYASLIPDMAKLAGKCVLECERRLVSLFARSFAEVEVIPRSTPPHSRTLDKDIMLQSPAGSLMRWLRPDVASFPSHEGYLKADADRVKHWKERFADLGGGLKVGICWTSGDRSAMASKHCIALEQWGPIFAVKGAEFVNLQYTDCREELAEAEQRFGIRIHRWDGLDLKNDLDEVAALTSALDLVIAVETAVPTLAGALGKAVWMMTPKNAGWKELGTGRMPWFPGMKLFHREWNETWDGVIGEVSRELAMLVSEEAS